MCYAPNVEKIVHKGKIIEVVQKEIDLGSETKVFEFARRSPGTRIIIPHGENIILTKEFRYELGRYDYRLPGGKVFDTLDEYTRALNDKIDIDESAKKAAIKEAQEEVGVTINDLTFFHKSICGATVIWDLYYFVANEFTQTSQNLEVGEDVKTELVHKDEARAMCLDGRISEERSALVLLRFLNK